MSVSEAKPIWRPKERDRIAGTYVDFAFNILKPSVFTHVLRGETRTIQTDEMYDTVRGNE